MTREEILSLSGPALSEAVAEHLMGWKRVDPGHFRDAAGANYFTQGAGDGNWQPHNDMRAAMQVIEAVDKHVKIVFSARRGFEGLDHGEDGSWRVGFAPHSDFAADTSYPVESMSLAEAICRAALLAVLAIEPAPGQNDEWSREARTYFRPA